MDKLIPMNFAQDPLIDAIFDFNEAVIGLPTNVPLNGLTDAQADWYETFVQEELLEFGEARDKKDLAGEVDAVCDLIYGAMGSLKKMGLTRSQANACFRAVHAANMTKVRGKTNRGSEEDAKKPADFVPPEEIIRNIIGAKGEA